MSFVKSYKQKLKERQAFKKIVAKRTTEVERKAYAEEAEKVAMERGKAKARRGTLAERFKARLAASAGTRTASRVAARTVARRVVGRRPVKRKAASRTRRRSAPARRRAVVRSSTPAPARMDAGSSMSASDLFS